jgi:hypothetical protein
MSRSSSSSSGSSRISTPPLSRRRSSSRLLPALPLAQLTPKMKRVAVDYSGMEGVQIVVQGESPAGPPVEYGGRRTSRLEVGEVINFGKVDASESFMRDSPDECLGYQDYECEEINTYTEPRSTPPRPSRRAPPSPLLPPQPYFSRAASPADSGSHASTPKAERPPITEPVSLPMGRKRDSAQRRLSALRGLVGHLDFNQPWSVPEKVDKIYEEEAEGFVWACGEEPEVIPVPVPIPRVRRMTVSQDHGWDKAELPPRNESLVTPRRDSILRKPSSTPPRRKGLRSTDLRTPEPRPRQRTEVFEVASGGYSKSIESVSASPLPTTPTSTWRSSLSTDEIYQRVAAAGPIEVKRQEVIWEMCETEHAFVKSMRTVLRLFAIPLKTPQGKWIDGIPSRITELFDSLERVAHAHGVVSASQRDMRRRNEVIDVGGFIGMFRSWVQRLEVHEAYLLKFEAVVKLVEENVRDSQSVFGEFVRMQMKEEVLGSMSLGSMLLKPVQRLTKYPLFLKVSYRLDPLTIAFIGCDTSLTSHPHGDPRSVKHNRVYHPHPSSDKGKGRRLGTASTARSEVTWSSRRLHTGCWRTQVNWARLGGPGPEQCSPTTKLALITRKYILCGILWRFVLSVGDPNTFSIICLFNIIDLVIWS